MKNSIYAIPRVLLIGCIVVFASGAYAQPLKDTVGKAAHSMKETGKAHKQKMKGKTKNGADTLSAKKEKADGRFESAAANARTNKQKDSDDVKKKDTAEGKGAGHAYGKDKGGLIGKEFGQQRASESRLNKETRQKELDQTIFESRKKVDDSKEKIKKAKETLARNNDAKKITREEYLEKKRKIEKAEAKVQEIEATIGEANEGSAASDTGTTEAGQR